jgi:hypothetical protein
MPRIVTRILKHLWADPGYTGTGKERIEEVSRLDR